MQQQKQCVATQNLARGQNLAETAKDSVTRVVAIPLSLSSQVLCSLAGGGGQTIVLGGTPGEGR